MQSVQHTTALPLMSVTAAAKKPLHNVSYSFFLRQVLLCDLADLKLGILKSSLRAAEGVTVVTQAVHSGMVKLAPGYPACSLRDG